MCGVTTKLRLEGNNDTTLFGSMGGREITFLLLSLQLFHYFTCVYLDIHKPKPIKTKRCFLNCIVAFSNEFISSNEFIQCWFFSYCLRLQCISFLTAKLLMFYCTSHIYYDIFLLSLDQQIPGRCSRYIQFCTDLALPCTKSHPCSLPLQLL